MENISSRLKAIDYNNNDFTPADLKFIGALLAKVSLENVFSVVSFLKAKGYELKPSNWKVVTIPFEILKERYEAISSLGEEDIFLSDLNNLCKKTLLDRVRYFKENEISLKDGFGKYKKEVLDIIAFQKYQAQEKVSWEIDVPISSDEISKESIQEGLSKASEAVVPNIDAQQNKLIFEDPQEKLKVEPESSTNNINEDIKEGGLTNDQKERYLRLEQSLNDVIKSITNNKIQVEKAKENIKKLVLLNIPKDEGILYYSLTNGFGLSEEEKQTIKNIINQPPNLSKDEISGGRAA
ncbi:MAG: hypothetical protein GX951_03175 [Mollicutes bacterium]|nr:hypothetical protein [Mollicutes bacterium]